MGWPGERLHSRVDHLPASQGAKMQVLKRQFQSSSSQEAITHVCMLPVQHAAYQLTRSYMDCKFLRRSRIQGLCGHLLAQCSGSFSCHCGLLLARQATGSAQQYAAPHCCYSVTCITDARSRQTFLRLVFRFKVEWHASTGRICSFTLLKHSCKHA